MTRYAISRATGASEGMLSRFRSGETDMTLGMLDRLATVIGVKVVVQKPRRWRKGGRIVASISNDPNGSRRI